MKDVGIAALLMLIGSAKVACFVIAVRRALRPRRGSSGDDGGYWPDWEPAPWPVQPKPAKYLSTR